MSRVIGEYLERAHKLSDAGVVFVTVTLVQPEGHVPQDIGAKAIITDKGLVWGTVGGGRLEARAIEHALAMIARAEQASQTNQRVAPEMVRYELQRDLNMVCGGAATFFYEVSAGSNWNIVVFGAGHVAQATVSLLATFHCNLVCVDHRGVWLDKIMPHSNLRKVVAEDLPEQVSKFPKGAFYICMTQGHSTDLPIVREILKRQDAGFLGVIGSQPKSKTMISALQNEGFSVEQLATIRCPIGLPIGSNSPAEIAVSIAAQILEVRDAISR